MKEIFSVLFRKNYAKYLQMETLFTVKCLCIKLIFDNRHHSSRKTFALGLFV